MSNNQIGCIVRGGGVCHSLDGQTINIANEKISRRGDRNARFEPPFCKYHATGLRLGDFDFPRFLQF